MWSGQGWRGTKGYFKIPRRVRDNVGKNLKVYSIIMCFNVPQCKGYRVMEIQHNWKAILVSMRETMSKLRLVGCIICVKCYSDVSSLSFLIFGTSCPLNSRQISSISINCFIFDQGKSQVCVSYNNNIKFQQLQILYINKCYVFMVQKSGQKFFTLGFVTQQKAIGLCMSRLKSTPSKTSHHFISAIGKQQFLSSIQSTDSPVVE